MKPLLLMAFSSAAAWGQVDSAQIVAGAGRNWLTYAGDYRGWRYSTLHQITANNAGSLVPKWVFRVPDARGLRTSPIVYDGVLYITNSNSVYAVDGATGDAIWHYTDSAARAQRVNRGAAILGDRIYFTTSDNYLTALDRRTGGFIFARNFADTKEGVYSTSAPLIVGDRVIVGSAGGDSGMRGFVAALRASDGKELWRTYTVPAPGEKGSETWSGMHQYGGGATWLSGTFDSATGTLYWTTGNPWPDFSAARRAGDNLYTCSLLALDAATGKLKWHFQFTPHDTHDWDAQSWPVLLDLEWQGRPRKLVVHANRNGFYYVLDRITGEYLHAAKLVDRVSWASGIDSKGVPIEIPGSDPTPSGTLVCPGLRGATNWMGQSFNPGTGLLYVLTLEQCGRYTSTAQEPLPGRNFGGGGAAEVAGQVILRALDPTTGRRAWEYPMAGAATMWSGAMSTAGGVVFSGDDDGYFIALEARTGRHLWHFNMGEISLASPVSYEVDGKQYVVIASASAIYSFGLFESAPPR